MSSRFVCLLSVLVAATGVLRADSLPIVPTTTMTQETANNTSSASSFQATYQPQATSVNVSTLPVRSLLYSGSTTKLYASLMLWWGKSSHINAGYNSQDPAQVGRQLDDMQNRGIDGVIAAWYGKDSYENASALVLQQQAEQHNNFPFALMIDRGAIDWDSCSGCDATAAVIAHVNYLAWTYFSSPAYLQMGGRPVVLFFGMDAFTIDWAQVRAQAQGNPLFIFRNASAFTHTATDGGYSWIEPSQVTSTDPMDLAYLDYYYSKSLNYLSSENVFGSGYSGFDDHLASWGKNRYLTQSCGQTWISTWGEAGKYFSSSKQLPAAQIVTWNDYEEGTALEMGIDNCLGVSANVSGSTLSWTLSGTGSESTIDHYTVFVSQDGENLMKLADVASGTHSLDLSSYNLAAGSYSLAVKAVGKPSIQNHMTGAVPYTVAAANQPPTVTLSVSPNSGMLPLTVTATVAATDSDGIGNTKLDFGDGTAVNAATATHTYYSLGTFTVTATATDTLGASATASQDATSTACKASTASFNVNICVPVASSTLGSVVEIAAASYSSAGIKQMIVYIDGVKKYSTSAASFDTKLTIASGTHKLTVTATNKKGSKTQKAISFTVR